MFQTLPQMICVNCKQLLIWATQPNHTQFFGNKPQFSFVSMAIGSLVLLPERSSKRTYAHKRPPVSAAVAPCLTLCGIPFRIRARYVNDDPSRQLNALLLPISGGTPRAHNGRLRRGRRRHIRPPCDERRPDSDQHQQGRPRQQSFKYAVPPRCPIALHSNLSFCIREILTPVYPKKEASFSDDRHVPRHA